MGGKVDRAFRAKVRELADKRKFDANWLMAVMALETGGKFKAYTPEKGGTGAVGLIQFTRTTARKTLGTTTEALARMTEVQQLDYVDKYFEPYYRDIKSLDDMYMSVFYPAARTRPNDYVLFSAPSKEYTNNSSLDRAHKGYVTREDAVYRVRNWLKEGKQYVA